jgi:hypothetical protein
MTQKKRWIVPLVIVLIILAGVGGYFGYYFYALTQLKITDVEISEFTEFNLKGFSFNGHIDMYNPSLISVSIKQIEYAVIFEPTDQLLSSGVLEGTKLPSKQITRIPFQKSINWAPALSLMIQLVTEDQPANIVFTGKVFVTDKTAIPFVYKVDVRAYFEKYVQEYLESQKQSVVDKIEERYGKTIGTIAEHVAGYLPQII